MGSLFLVKENDSSHELRPSKPNQHNGASQQTLPGNGAPTDDLPNHEPALVKLYKELTGEDESQARNTFMFVIGNTDEPRNPT